MLWMKGMMMKSKHEERRFPPDDGDFTFAPSEEAALRLKTPAWIVDEPFSASPEQNDRDHAASPRLHWVDLT